MFHRLHFKPPWLCVYGIQRGYTQRRCSVLANEAMRVCTCLQTPVFLKSAWLQKCSFPLTLAYPNNHIHKFSKSDGNLISALAEEERLQRHWYKAYLALCGSHGSSLSLPLPSRNEMKEAKVGQEVRGTWEDPLFPTHGRVCAWPSEFSEKWLTVSWKT